MKLHIMLKIVLQQIEVNQCMQTGTHILDMPATARKYTGAGLASPEGLVRTRAARAFQVLLTVSTIGRTTRPMWSNSELHWSC